MGEPKDENASAHHGLAWVQHDITVQLRQELAGAHDGTGNQLGEKGNEEQEFKGAGANGDPSTVDVDGVTHELHQEGSGSHYSHTYFYQNADDSNTDVTQKGNANHNAQIRLQGTEHTNLTILQQGNTNQSYSVTQTCYTVGGCSINVTQGN